MASSPPPVPTSPVSVDSAEVLVLQSGELMLMTLELPPSQPMPPMSSLPSKTFVTLTDTHMLLSRDEASALDPFFVLPLTGQRASFTCTRPEEPGTLLVLRHTVAGTAALQAPSIPAAKRWARAVDLAISALATEDLERGLEAAGCRIYPEQLRLFPGDAAAGGQGVVLRGLLLNRIPVAVKELRFSEEFSTPRDKESFFREMAMLSAVDHPSIVRFFGFCRSVEGRVRMVTEFVSGGDLSAYLFDEAHYPIDERRAARLALSISEGIEFLHSKGVVHRDLKPENVLVADWNSCTVRICDFGLCRTAEQRASWTMNLGTPLYAAPEYDSSGSAFPLDAFSFGVILWEIVARKEPFKECKWVSDIRCKIEKGEHPPVPETAPAWLRMLVERCRSITPKERPTFADISGVLRGALQDIVIRSGVSTSPVMEEMPATSPGVTPRKHHHIHTPSGHGHGHGRHDSHDEGQLSVSSSSDPSDPALSEFGGPLSRQSSDTALSPLDAAATLTSPALPPAVQSPRQERADSVGEPVYTHTQRGRFISSADLSPMMSARAASGGSLRVDSSKYRRGTMDASWMPMPGVSSTSGTESVRSGRSSSLSRGKAKIAPAGMPSSSQLGSSASATEAVGETAPTAPVVPSLPMHQFSGSSLKQQQQQQQAGDGGGAGSGQDLSNWGFFGSNGAVSAMRMLAPAFEEVWTTELPACKDGIVSLLVDPRTATLYAGCNGRITAMSCFLGIIKWQVAIPSLDGARLSMQFLNVADSSTGIVLGGAGHLVCISRERGAMLWDIALPGRSSYATLVHVLQYPGNAQRLLIGANGHLCFVDTSMASSATLENIVPMNAHISFGVTLTAFSTAALDSNPLIINAATNSLLCSVTAAGFLTRTNAFKTPFAITQLVVRDTLVLAYYHSGCKVRACHPATLRQRWRTSLLGRAFGSVTTVVSLTCSDREPSLIYIGCCGWVFALDITTGKERAKVSLPGSHSGPTLVHAFPPSTFGGLVFACCHGTMFLIDPTTLAVVHKSPAPHISAAASSGATTTTASSTATSASSSSSSSSSVITAASATLSMDEHSTGFLLAGVSKLPQASSKP